MRATLVLVMGLSACGFAGSGEGAVDGPPGDGSGSGSGDGPVGCKLFVDLCGEAASDQPLLVTSTVKIDTDRDVRCRVRTQTGGPSICALFFTRLEIQGGATLTFYGSRPVAISASEEIVIGGVLDLSSRRNDQVAEPAAGSQNNCTFARAAEDDVGGGAGGAGGSFATKGGDGGNGDADNDGSVDDDTALGGLAGAPSALSVLRGGCSGQAGAYNGSNPARGRAGRGGGAVYLTAPKITISGAIKAAGAGGSGGGADSTGGGGGGGGSGGLIVVESPVVDGDGAILFATGGGGGQGGDLNSYGEDGGDADGVAVPGAGGDAANNGGNGGDGALSGDGDAGTGDNAGGGGGGGGVGFIRIISKRASLTGAQITPEAEVIDR